MGRLLSSPYERNTTLTSDPDSARKLQANDDAKTQASEQPQYSLTKLGLSADARMRDDSELGNALDPVCEARFGRGAPI